jgi:nucleotidyltransferase substrate binding protein (TIGR01987 family)
VQAFGFTFELSWKTLKDCWAYAGLSDVSFPGGVIKQAFHDHMIQNGEAWVKMLDERN